ncbi:MAG: ribonuclease III [Eubacteriales bacterium]
MNMNEADKLQQLQQTIEYQFKNIDLLKQALTHSSYANEKRIRQVKDYERIEFLGDAVLELVSSEYLYLESDAYLEGEMTKLRSTYVCEPALAFCARELHIGQYIYLGKGEQQTGGRERDSILSDCMEAIIGAIFLDSNFEEAKQFIHRNILSDLEDKKLFYDSKSSLQEFVQAKGKPPVTYRLVDESGPEHDKIFTIEVILEENIVGRGTGKNKKSAEQNAAYQAIKMFKNQVKTKKS